MPDSATQTDLISPVERPAPASIVIYNENIDFFHQNNFCASLWQQCEDIISDVMKTGGISGFYYGLLPPENYARLLIEDVQYMKTLVDQCAKLIAILEKDEKYDNIRNFIGLRLNRYQDVLDEMYINCSIFSTESIKMRKEFEEYCQYKDMLITQISQNQFSPIYFLISLLPCDMLWSWIGQALNESVFPNNVYKYWIKEAQTYSGGQVTREFINTNLESILPEKAFEVFQQCMIYEKNIFDSMECALSANGPRAINKLEDSSFKNLPPHTVTFSNNTRSFAVVTDELTATDDIPEERGSQP